MEHTLRDELINLGKNSKEASRELKNLDSNEKNKILDEIKLAIDKNRKNILEQNAIDVDEGKANGLNKGLIDRLMLDDSRLDGMIDSIDVVKSINDPVGEVFDVNLLPNNLYVAKKRVPIGVIGMIYEARPNVTLDASILAIKSSNTIILRGGKECIKSSIAIADAIREGIKNAGYNENIVQIIEDTSRESSTELMKLKGYIDLLIPRGSARLINAVIEIATVPVLETGTGNNHLYVDDEADIKKALAIFENGKAQRVGVCNALENLLIHKDISDEFYKGLNEIIKKHDLKVHADKNVIEKIDGAEEATDEDFATEYLDYEFSVKLVDDIDEAIDHIYRYSTGHSEAIVTENIVKARKFIDEVDAAAVYVNASTRFTDGGEFGYGAEIGISTQKFHARGPVGVKELTTYKYFILGEGQIRN